MYRIPYNINDPIDDEDNRIPYNINEPIDYEDEDEDENINEYIDELTLQEKKNMVLEAVRNIEQNDISLVGINRQKVHALLHADSINQFNDILGGDSDSVFQIFLKINLPILSDEIWTGRFDGITGAHIWEFWEGYNDGYNMIELEDHQEGSNGPRVYTDSYLRGYGNGRQDRFNSYPNYYVRKYKPMYDTMTGKKIMKEKTINKKKTNKRKNKITNKKNTTKYSRNKRHSKK
jgi:hypothetical protein